MSRRVRRKTLESQEKDKLAILPTFPDCRDDRTAAPAPDWTTLPDDAMIHLFSILDYRDRATLSSTCRAFRLLASSPFLWSSLDLRFHRLSPSSAASLSSRTSSALHRLRFRGSDAAVSILSLRSQNLREISGESCRDITDADLSALAARHDTLECLQFGPEPCGKITGDAIRVVAICCPRLRRLRLSGLREIDEQSIGTLRKCCNHLEEIAFLDCGIVDERGFEDFSSLRYLSVAGCRRLKWTSAALLWSELPNLVALDVSRTQISPHAVSRILSGAKGLKVLCALNCIELEEEKNHEPTAFSNTKGKLLLANFTNILKEINCPLKKSKDIEDWVEWILSHSLLRMAETYFNGIGDFWLRQGIALLLSLVKSSQEDVRERVATGLATFMVVEDDNSMVHRLRAEAVMRKGGIPLLLDLARSSHEAAQCEAAKAVSNLAVNDKVAKAVADGGGIRVLVGLAKSKNRWVAEEAVGGLWNLSVGEENKEAIMEAGGVKAMVDLLSKWSSGMDGVLERAAGALANLAADGKSSMEIAAAGGVHALVMLARSSKAVGVQEQAARALANLAAHGDSNSNNAAVGQERGALEALVHLTCSHSEGVRQEAAGALWNLSFDDKNREAIAAAGGIEALVAIVKTCSNASKGLQERAAGALWGLSVSEANCTAIGREGGVAPLIALARSDAEDVHETATGALWNLAFNYGNAVHIAEEGGVAVLLHICSSSGSKMARFMAALALSYMFDGRTDKVASVGASSNGTSKSTSKTIHLDGSRTGALKQIEAFVMTFSDPQAFSAAAASSSPASLAQAMEATRIQEAESLRCSDAEIKRFADMLKNSSSVLRGCASFALLQFTIPGGRHSAHHASLLQKHRGARTLRSAAAAATAPINYKIFARMVLRNLEQHQIEASI